MRNNSFWIVYLILAVLQLLVSNYLNFSPYLVLSLLPVMVLCISTRISTFWTMCIAFATALAVDFLAEGTVGLNVLALVPVAYARSGIIRLVFGDELFAREEDFTVTRNGFARVSVAILIALAIYLAVYIFADNAGRLPFWFNAARFGISLASGYVLSILAVGRLAPDTRR